MKLSVIIVSYKVRFYLEQCLLAVEKATEGIEAEIYVVDNHSGDGTVEYITERFPEINFINSNHNLGFSRANNVAIKQSCGEYVLLLNPDTIVAEDSIRDVLSFMEDHPKAGGAGVRMLCDDGRSAMESRRGLPSPMTAFYKMSGLCAKYPKSRRFGKYYMSYLSWDEPTQIEVISGAFCMLRRSALDKIGLLDEDFFMYGEDIDLSYRLLKGGYENWYLPSVILHYKGESAHKSSFRYVHVFYDAMLIFFRKHYGGMSLLVSLPVKTAIYVKATATFVKMQIHSVEKKLGLLSHRKRITPHYIFIGSRKAVAKCRQIAKRNALEADFFEGHANDMPDGHLGLDMPDAARTYVVYDTGAYSYKDIFSLFQRCPKDTVRIGTYNPKTNIVITGEDIFK